MKFNTENPIESVFELYRNDVSGQTAEMRNSQVFDAMAELEEMRDEQTKIVKILHDHKQGWDYAPSDGVRSLVERLAEVEQAVREHFKVTQIPTSMLRPTEKRLLELLGESSI